MQDGEGRVWVSIAAGDYRAADTSRQSEWLADTNYRCLSYMLSHTDYPLVYPSWKESYGGLGAMPQGIRNISGWLSRIVWPWDKVRRGGGGGCGGGGGGGGGDGGGAYLIILTTS